MRRNPKYAAHFLSKGGRWFILFLSACCFWTNNIFPQHIENYFTHYTTKEGLPDGNLYGGIIQDSTGFLWIGYENGLSRFDGHSFKTYRYSPVDTNTLRENSIVALFLDSKKRLWVLSSAWLYLYHPAGEWFEHFGINTLGSDKLNWICAEEHSQLIIAGNKSLYMFDMQQKKFSFFYHDGIAFQSFGDYKKDEAGIEWITSENGLIRYDPKIKKSLLFDSSVLKHKGNDRISAVHIILLPGYLLASTYKMGFILVNRKTNQFK